MKRTRRFLAAVLTLTVVLSVGVVGTAAAAAPYPDMAEDASYQETVGYLTQVGIFAGQGDGNFHGEASLTRAEAARVVVNMKGTTWNDRFRESTPMDLSAYTEAPCSDVSASHWAAGCIAYCAEQGIITGYEDGTFRPEEPVTYAEFAAIILRALELAEPADWTQTTSLLTQAGLDANLSRPIAEAADEACTRADCAEMVMNALFYGETYTETWAYINLGLPRRPDVYGMPYLDDGNPKHTMDIYYPDAEAPEGGYPVLLMIRGGGFRRQTKTGIEVEDFIGVVDEGYVLISMEYSDAEEHPLPYEVAEAKAAIRTIRANAEALRVNGDAIFLSGKSAGAIISAAAGTTADSPAYDALLAELGAPDVSDAVSGVILYYPQTNYATAWSQKAWQAGTLAEADSALAAEYDEKYADYAQYNVNFAETDPGADPSAEFNAQLGASIDDSAETLAMITANQNIGENTPPFFIRHGTADVVLPFLQSVDFARDLEAAGIDVNFKLIEGEGHASAAFVTLVPTSEKVEWMNGILAGE